MTQYVGTHYGKLDRKGRISVPANFRAVVEASGSQQVILRASHQHPCIEVRTRPAFQAMVATLVDLAQFSEDRDDLEMALVADAIEMRIDAEGRAVLPEPLITALGLGENIAFVAKSEHFEIWDAEAARARIAEAKARVLSKGLTLPGTGAFRRAAAANPLNTNPRDVP